MEAELIAWDSYARELERADAAPARSSTRLRLKQLMRERHELQQRLANQAYAPQQSRALLVPEMA